MPSIPVTVRATIAAPRASVFDFVVAEDVLPKVLLGYGPLPAVVGTSGNTGPWDRVGSRRTVHLAGGDTAREEVTAFRRPDHFAYRVSDLPHPLRRLADSAQGAWWFEARPGATAVTWSYTFHARSALAAVALAPFAAILWRGYMRRCTTQVARLATG